MSKGKLIVVEGLEGAGKSSAIETVLACLKAHQIPTITTREPGGTVIGETLRDLIKNPLYKDQLQDKSELLLMYAARIQLLEEVIKPALDQGTWVVADRFELSTFAYQGGGRGLDLEFMKALSSFAMADFQADLVLYLDISPEVGMARASRRGAFDRIEQQAIDFFHKVHQSYLEHVNGNPDIRSIDASLSFDQVQKSIQDTVQQFLNV